MGVLAVLCHPDPDSFSGALLDRFVAGIEDADIIYPGQDTESVYHKASDWDGCAPWYRREQWNECPLRAEFGNGGHRITPFPRRSEKWK